MEIIFNTKTTSDYTLITFEIDVFFAEDLKEIAPPDPIKNNFAHKGVIISGRGPIWLYGYLIHYYHPAKWVATHDPRLKGAVVVQSHTKDVKVGDLITFEIPKK